MNEQNDETLGGSGFETEGVKQKEQVGQDKPKPKRSLSDEMKRNFKAVFGHGVGKISLILAAVIVIGGIAFGYRGLTSKPKEMAQSEVDVPNAPQPTIELGDISKQESIRRAQQAALEAEEAAALNRTYQPGFDVNIVNKESLPSGTAQFSMPKIGSHNSPSSQRSATELVNITVPTNQPIANRTQTESQSTQTRNQDQQAEQQARQRLEQELKQAQDERDKYVAAMKDQVMKQVQALFGDAGQGGLNAQGAYSTVSYYPANLNNGNKQSDDTGNGPKSAVPEMERSVPALGDPKGKLLIKTGNIMYATLDSEVNTDDGGDVLATIRGGKWDKAKIIGKVEQAPNNIRLKFSTLAPQDGRPTMRINAIALREEDAKQGVAEDINHHSLERYTALAVASLLAGYGRAYMQPTGTTVFTNGGIYTTTQEPSTKRVIGTSVGEMGQAMSGEIRRGFDRPTTYSTPAQQGFGLYFLQDVYEQQ